MHARGGMAKRINWLQNGGLFENYTGIHICRDLGQ